MIETVKEYHELLNRLRELNSEDRLSNHMKSKLEGLEECEGLVKNLDLGDVVGRSEQLPFDFVKWYSGMEEQKILNAYKRWQKEKG
jgi:hypothetical protein